jgi:putative DNA primase/helicase
MTLRIRRSLDNAPRCPHAHIRHHSGVRIERRSGVKIRRRLTTKPRIRTTDVAMRARMTLIPFAVNFEGREDRGLPERLKAEAGAILRWAIEGAVEWQRSGLRVPAAVERASRDYMDSEDSLAHFLEDETTAAPGVRVARDTLYARYRVWAGGQGVVPATNRAFVSMLRERCPLISEFNSNGTRGFVGLQLRDAFEGGVGDAL